MEIQWTNVFCWKIRRKGCEYMNWEWVRIPAVESQEKGRAILYIGANVPEKSLAPVFKVEE